MYVRADVCNEHFVREHGSHQWKGQKTKIAEAVNTRLAAAGDTTHSASEADVSRWLSKQFNADSAAAAGRCTRMVAPPLPSLPCT